MRPHRLLPFALALAFALGACSGYSRHVDASKRPTDKPVSYGGGITVPQPVQVNGSEAKALGNKSKLVVTVLDDAHRPLAGAIVRFKGPQKVSRATNSKGVAIAIVKPGQYAADVAPCGTTVITTSYLSGDFVIGPGQRQDGTLDDISWKWRYAPQPSAVMPAPPWKIGRQVVLGVRVEDGCDHKLAPRATIASFGWKLSKNFAATARPSMKADAAGYARIRVSCRVAGNGYVKIYDAQGKADEVDLLSAGQQPPDGHTFCE
jgi:hypothetical protein